MFTKSLRSIARAPFLRLKVHEKPEFQTDFIRYPFGIPPVEVISMEKKVDHGFDYASESYDYEDHGMTVLHQRPSHYRYFWIFAGFWVSSAFLYFIWLEVPYTGTFFGHYNMDIEMNAIKYVNNDELYHDWEGLKKKYLEREAAAEEGGEDEEITPEE
ncbi:unnamed protein product [Blepharisma stoltei]|uniref:Uncharacterized protein n=1 Tax=Blepharisma stoltei TaxID=1481888 RepID=A0AAU9IDP1_9CILI|nr:unnamed protein product [Blepharisma stoltei]